MKPSPTKAAIQHGIRTYGCFWFTAMSPQARKQLVKAFIAGARYQKRLQRNGSK